MTIEVITFDLDNTLWDVEPALIKAEDAQREWLLVACNKRGSRWASGTPGGGTPPNDTRN